MYSVAKAITDTFTCLGDFEIPESMLFQAGYCILIWAGKIVFMTQFEDLEIKNQIHLP